MIEFFQQHPYAASAISTWIFNNVVSAFVGSLPAPTSTSTPRYVFIFRFFNTVIGNLKRAQSTAVENSPNWQAAVEKHVETLQKTQDATA